MQPPPDAARRPRLNRRTQWLYAILFSFTLFVVLALIGSLLVMPWAMRRHYLQQVLASPEPPAKAVTFWVRQINDHPAQRARLVELCRSLRDDPEQFCRLAGLFVAARRLSEQPEDLRITYLRYTWLSSASAQERQSAVLSLMQFAGDWPDALAAAIDDAIGDESPDVAAEAAYVLPFWAEQPWTRERLLKLLTDARDPVRRQAALAVGIAADAMDLDSDSDAHTVLYRLVNEDHDAEVRANACWSLYRLGGIEAGPALPSEAPVSLRRIWPLAVGRGASDVRSAATTLSRMLLDETDAVAADRAALGLTLLSARDSFGGDSDAVPAAVYEKLLSNKRWPSVAIACRLIGLNGRADLLNALETLVLMDERPDLVSEQVAFALGELAAQPSGATEDERETFDRQARAALAALTKRSLIRGREPGEPDAAAVSPRTQLAACIAWSRLGELDPLIELAGRSLPPAPDRIVGPDTMADLACLELARIAQAQAEHRKAVVKAAEELGHSYVDRLQRSGSLLIGLLGIESERAWLARRWRSERVSSDDPLTGIYMQAALKLMGQPGVDDDVPTKTWLNAPDACTPGFYAAMALAGERGALDQLLGDRLDPDGQASADAMLDEWGFRRRLGEWADGPVEPIEAADTEWIDQTRRMSAWWYQTRGHRLTYDAANRRWSLGVKPSSR